jgi:uncharacterized membrane protein
MLYVILSTLFFGIAIFLIKVSATQISPLVANLFFALTQLVVQVIVLVVARSRGMLVHVTSSGVKTAVLGGVLIGFYTLFLFLSFSKLDITKVTPIVYAGGILISSVLGLLFLNETMTFWNISGLMLILAGIFLIFIK